MKPHKAILFVSGLKTSDKKFTQRESDIYFSWNESVCKF